MHIPFWTKINISAFGINLLHSFCKNSWLCSWYLVLDIEQVHIQSALRRQWDPIWTSDRLRDHHCSQNTPHQQSIGFWRSRTSGRRCSQLSISSSTPGYWNNGSTPKAFSCPKSLQGHWFLPISLYIMEHKIIWWQPFLVNTMTWHSWDFYRKGYYR